MSPFIFIFLLHSFTTPPQTSASNILFFHSIATTSHRTSIWPLVERLAENGHNITYIFPADPRGFTHPKVEDIAPSKMFPILKQFVSDFDINIRLNNTVDAWLLRCFSKSIDLCEAFYDSPETKAWLSRPGLSYDLVVLDTSLGECGYGLVHRFKAKHILYAPLTPPFMYDGFGFVPETFSIPELFFHRKPSKMGFYSRLVTTLSPLLFRLAFLDTVRKTEPIFTSRLNFTDFPGIVEYERNTSLLLMNIHFIEEYPMSLPPIIQSISGLSCARDNRDKGRKPLPDEISKFINQGVNSGFIYVSFGSAVIISDLPKDIMDKFFTAFKAFPNLKFLWRWTGAVPEDKPPNLMLKKWFPQRDILAHSKIKGFLTQAGRPSTQEALCYGVPLLTFPIFGDQMFNADRLEQLGVSVDFDINNFTAAELQHGIESLVSDSSPYRAKMKEMSAIFRDRPVDPVDNALYWTEFVLRHDTSLLKPLGINYRWWERRLLDVYAVLFLGVIIFFVVASIVTYFIVKLILRLAFTKKPKTE